MRGQVSAAAIGRHEKGPLISISAPEFAAGPAGGPPPGEDREPGRGRAEADRGSGECIMVVEDDYLVALSIESALVEAGYRVAAVVPSGEQALAAAEHARPDLVLMDIRLIGELDGIETARALHRVGIRSLFASAHSDPQTRQRGQSAEPLGWLTKPFTSTQMLVAIAQALHRMRGGSSH